MSRSLTQEAERIQAMKKHISLLPFNPTPDEVDQIIKAVLMAEHEVDHHELSKKKYMRSIKVNIDKIVGEINLTIDNPKDAEDIKTIRETISNALVGAIKADSSWMDESVAKLVPSKSVIEIDPLIQIQKIIHSSAELETKLEAIDQVLFQRRNKLSQLQKEKAKALISSFSQDRQHPSAAKED